MACIVPDTKQKHVTMSLDDYPIDDDYIGVDDAQKADVSRSDEYRYDGSYTYNRDDNGLYGTERDVEIDRRKVSDDDKRGGTRTGFDAEEGSGFYADVIIREGRAYTRSKWLRLLNNGYRSPERYVDNTLRDKESYLDVFATVLDITDYQKNRTEAIVESIDMSEMAHYPRELIILATISIVTNEDDRWIREEDAFKGLVRDLDGSMQGIKNARQLLKRKSDIF